VAAQMTDNSTGPAAHNLPEFTVSEISGALKRTLEDQFAHVRIRGEISGFKRAASGHLYFALKDDKAVIDSVCWRGTAGNLSLRPEDGMEVIVTGRVTTYPARSRYQVVVESIELAGEGALLKLLEDRRRRLAEEGLFNSERKRPLPYLPNVIGVVTSPTGAVIRDILHRLADRFPRHVVVWPVLVQGEGAAEQIAAAIRGFNALAPGAPVPRPDLLIVARGGGSLEDLWAFNEEVVVRAAAASEIPLISAVGHETDTTLIDFASDRRAPTPTAAAEMAVPVRAELLAQVLDDARRLISASARLMTERRTRLESLVRGLGDPRRILESPSQRVDFLGDRLARAGAAGLERRAARLDRAAGRLLSPRQAVRSARQRLGDVSVRLRPELISNEIARDLKRLVDLEGRTARAIGRSIRDGAARLAAQAQLLGSLSYERVLERGFALVRGADGAPVTAAAGTHPGMAVAIRFRDGEVGATVAGAGPAATPKPRARRTDDKKGGPQGSLL
jgi:exodeoxyribonuclease VII large subunit